MSNKNVDSKAKRSLLSKFFLLISISWGLLWIVYVLTGIPIVMLSKSVAYDPAAMTASESLLLGIGNFSHTALRWVFPVSLPVIWQIVHWSNRDAEDEEKKHLSQAGVISVLTCIAILIILAFAHTVLSIDRLREGGGFINNLLIRLHAILTAAPIGLAAVAYTLLARKVGKSTGSKRLSSFGRMAVIAAAAMLAITVVAAFATVVKGTWMNIDWIAILPLAASVIFECARSSVELSSDAAGDAE